MFRLNSIITHLHDFLSAFRVRFLSRGAVRGVDVAVLTNDSNISSSPSVNVSSDNLSAGERSTSGRRRRSPVYGDELSTLSTDGLCVPSNCLQSNEKINFVSNSECFTPNQMCNTYFSSASARSSFERNFATSMINLPRVLLRSRWFAFFSSC